MVAKKRPISVFMEYEESDNVEEISTNSEKRSCCWVAIVEKEGEEAQEIQTEDDATLLLSSLRNLFKDVTTLKYKGPSDVQRIVRCIGGVLYPPGDDGGWGSHTYVCVMKKKQHKFLKSSRKRITDPNNPFATDDDEDDLDDNETNWSKSILVHYEGNEPVSEEKFRECFSQFGEIKCCLVKTPKEDQPGSAFIRFDNGSVPMSLYGADMEIEGIKLEIKEPETDVKEKRKVVIIFRNENITKQDLREHFSKYGKVTDVYIPRPFKYFGFVTLSKFSDCRKLYGKVHKLQGSELRLQEPRAAKEKRQRQQYGSYGADGWANPGHFDEMRRGGGGGHGPMGGMVGGFSGYGHSGFGGGYSRPGKKQRGMDGGQGGGWVGGGRPGGGASNRGSCGGMGMGFGGQMDSKSPCPYNIKNPEQMCPNYDVCSNYYEHGMMGGGPGFGESIK